MASIDGDKPITPQMKEIYKQECTRGVELFQRSLKEYQKSQIPAQKDEYRDVMDKALQIIKETASQCLGKEMQKEGSNLQKDYDTFIANPSDNNLNRLNNDLEHFKKEI
ncbi:MAG TPA: hypothetical protein PKW79_04690 [Rhabdochlamydiaceae bacterium]|jgi:hypothetical protein|nr:hypothetical protein [Rhabdochlamydiaceae bacterium]